MSKQTFINQSLELNLFFLRIMKEHAIFLEAAFSKKDKNLISQASVFKNQFTRLLLSAIALSEGVISPKVLASNEIVTKYTLAAEKKTQFVSGIFIDTSLTSRELLLSPGMANKDISLLSDKVRILNQHSIEATDLFITFKTKLKNDFLSCKIFINVYPSLLEHVIEEAAFFRESLTNLQLGVDINTKIDILTIQSFFNDIMSEHAFFIRGLLDPTEVELFNIANTFGKEFEILEEKASTLIQIPLELVSLTDKTLNATIRFRDFKAQATQGLLECQIKSIIIPLLADHVLREANYYINLLDTFSDLQTI